jgi:hypothetical protein
MTKDEALDIAMKEYAQTHYPDDCKTFKRGYEAGWANAEQNVVAKFNPDWDEKAVLVEEMQRMAKRIEELERGIDFSIKAYEILCPPQGRTFDDYGNKLP